MATKFHDESFSAETQLKLELFRRYIRKWVPVFMTKPRMDANRKQRSVHIFDLFAGPGTDANGEPGSPLLVMKELQSFCQQNKAIRIPNPDVQLYFSDDDPAHIDALRRIVSDNICPAGCCKPIVQKQTFQDAIDLAMPTLMDEGKACLVIMDQFGLKEVTPELVIQLSRCPVTDIVFFISSSFIRRFADEAAVQKYFCVSADDIRKSDYRSIHRYICDYYRSKLPKESDYYLVPFSIKKGANIYGVIFGSGNMLGLYKALQTCWELDGVTGEANYSVDGDIVWSGQQSLFADDNVPRKRDLYRRSLEQIIKERSMHSPLKGANNREIFRQTLESGFLPKHAKEELRRLENEKRIEVVPLLGDKLRKGTYYVSWDEYQNPQKKFRCVFRYVGGDHETKPN